MKDFWEKLLSISFPTAIWSSLICYIISIWHGGISFQIILYVSLCMFIINSIFLRHSEIKLVEKFFTGSSWVLMIALGISLAFSYYREHKIEDFNIKKFIAENLKRSKENSKPENKEVLCLLSIKYNLDVKVISEIFDKLEKAKEPCDVLFEIPYKYKLGPAFLAQLIIDKKILDNENTTISGQESTAISLFKYFMYREFTIGDFNMPLLRDLLKEDTKANNLVLQELGLNADQLDRVSENGIVNVFNRLLKKNDFYSKIDVEKYKSNLSYFQKLLLEIAQSSQKHLSDKDYSHLNRALLKAIYLKGIQKNPKVKSPSGHTVVSLLNEYNDIVEQSPEKRGVLLKAIKRLSEKYGIEESVVANLLVDDKILGRQTSSQSEDSEDESFGDKYGG